MNRDIRATVVYILNDFKQVHNKIYFNFSALTREDFRAVNLMIRNIKLIKNFWINVFLDNDFVESSSIIINRVDITEINISTSSIRTIVFKFSILKIVFIISRKASQVEKIDQLNKSNIVSSAVSSVSF